MVTRSTLPTADFTQAKARFSDIVSSAVRRHIPQLVTRHAGKEWAAVIDPSLLEAALSDYRFEAVVVVDAVTGEVTIRLERFGILGSGADFEAALEDTVAELRAYAREFFSDWAFYRRSNRAGHLPWLLRFALTPDQQQADLLLEPPAAATSPRASNQAVVA